MAASFSFIFEFDETRIKSEGREKYVDGFVSVDVYTSARGNHLEDIDIYPMIRVTRWFDAETETDIPREFTVTRKMATYAAIEDEISELVEEEALRRMRDQPEDFEDFEGY